MCIYLLCIHVGMYIRDVPAEVKGQLADIALPFLPNGTQGLNSTGDELSRNVWQPAPLLHNSSSKPQNSLFNF